MCCEGDCSERAEVVDPVERWFGGRQVESTEQKVDLVRVARSQRLCELLPDPCCCRFWSEFDVVSALIPLQWKNETRVRTLRKNETVRKENAKEECGRRSVGVEESLPDAVKSSVAFNVFRKLQSVSWFSREGHYEVIRENLLLVDIGLHFYDGTSGIAVRSNNGVSLSGDTE